MFVGCEVSLKKIVLLCFVFIFQVNTASCLFLENCFVTINLPGTMIMTMQR